VTSERCSTVQHLSAVLAVVGLSLVLQVGLDMGRMLSDASTGSERGMAHYIAGPDSEAWGHTVLKLSGML